MPRKPNKRELNPVQLELLLRGLDEDRVRAGVRYNRLHARLVEYALRNSRCDPEELADTVIICLAGKNAEVPIPSSEIEPVAHGIAKKVVQEENRNLGKRLLPPRQTTVENWFDRLRGRLTDRSKPDKQCLEWAIEQLSEQDRKLIQDYYPQEIPGDPLAERKRLLAEKQGKLLARHRNLLAQPLDLGDGALRRRNRIIIRLERVIDLLSKRETRLIEDHCPQELRDERRKLLARHRNFLAQQEGIGEEVLRQRVVQIIRRLNRSYRDSQEKKS